MKNKGYFEYRNDIYPRRLWVIVGAYKELVEENFLDNDGEPLQYGKRKALTEGLFLT